MEKCLSLNVKKLDELGFKCEFHNFKYIYYCFYCQKNLCKICKEIHIHRTKIIDDIDKHTQNHLKEYEKPKKFNDIKKEMGAKESNTKTNEEVTKNLSKIYKDRKKMNYLTVIYMK